jgi:hypothetical protein
MNEFLVGFPTDAVCAGQNLNVMPTKSKPVDDITATQLVPADKVRRVKV